MHTHLCIQLVIPSFQALHSYLTALNSELELNCDTVLPGFCCASFNCYVSPALRDLQLRYQPGPAPCATVSTALNTELGLLKVAEQNYLV
jgi:hypothetical protein